MQEQINKLNRQLEEMAIRHDELEQKVNNFYDSSKMSIEFERAFLERFGMEGFRGMTFGVANMSSGTVTIVDPLITTTSIIVATQENSFSTQGTSAASLGAVCNSGNAVIFESTGIMSGNVNYIIFY